MGGGQLPKLGMFCAGGKSTLFCSVPSDVGGDPDVIGLVQQTPCASLPSSV